jgi:L-ascorbate metabolism protein UlaG (beta-lactamase superfamily)
VRHVRNARATAGVKVLVDPWLVDELTFAGQRWLYRGKKTHIPPRDPDEVAKGCDAIILSQVSCYTSCKHALAAC